MKISANKFVSATYDLYVGGEDGTQEELMEKATEDRPLSFIFGTGMMLEGFESHLAELEPDATFDFVLPSAEAYGEFIEENVVDLPRSIFEVDGKIDEDIIFENNTVPMMDSNGNHMNGTILTIGTETIKMDFNHPLAGEDLHFIGKVVEVRDATDADLKQFSGSCSCGDDCCSDCSGEEASGCGGCCH
ncbi:MAG: FKBP-type peptidyl-prolyl cis-trans isomerase [Bacteroidota bacterium]|nr:FKBP-type peptidyl-prolyl cis-trans isomerase [Bacteroidota bacterium]